MNTALYIARRLSSHRERSFSSFIMRISIAATAISVAVMIVALSFINGFQQVVADKVFGFWGHIRIQHHEPLRTILTEDTPIKEDPLTVRELKNTKNISHFSPFATRSAILNANGTLEGVMLKGVTAGYHFSKIDRFLKKGKWPALKDTLNNEIAISSYTAHQIGVDTGDHIMVYFIQQNSERPRTRKLKVSGIFSTGIDVYDKVYALGDLKMIQQLNAWEKDEVGGYEIDLKDPESMDTTAAAVFEQIPPGWNAYTLKELSPEIFDWLHLQHTNKYILIIIMTIIAMINLITCLIILLLERTNMIAVLKSLGMRDGLIQRTFLYYGGWIALKGVLIGTLLGLGICLLQQYGGIVKLNEEAYYVSTAPVVVNGIQVMMISGGTLLVSLLFLALPTWISKGISPAKAIRFK